MMPFTRSLAAVSLSIWLISGGLALAMTQQINDEGKFFSPAAIDKANQKIRDIYRDYGKDLLIETVARLPHDLQERYKALGKRKFFVDWAVKRAEESGCKGVYVLVCKSPGYLQIEVGRATRERGFTLGDRERLVEKMRPLLGKKDRKSNDEALMLAVNTIESTLRSNLEKRPRSEKQKQGTAAVALRAEKPHAVMATSAAAVASSESGAGLSPWTWILIGAGVLLVVWLLMTLLRAMTGGGAGAGSSGGAGGGGFFTSLLAGMFGAAAGAWLYDAFFHGGSSGHAFGATTADQPPSGHEPSDSDYGGDEGGGGDFGDGNTAEDPGGDFGDFGDFGGGDFGGGDFGGGDF